MESTVTFTSALTSLPSTLVIVKSLVPSPLVLSVIVPSAFWVTRSTVVVPMMKAPRASDSRSCSWMVLSVAPR